MAEFPGGVGGELGGNGPSSPSTTLGIRRGERGEGGGGLGLGLVDAEGPKRGATSLGISLGSSVGALGVGGWGIEEEATEEGA